MEVYAKQAKDGRLLRHASGIRLRAERRVGELLREQNSRGELAHHRRKKGSIESTLSDLGITKDESSDWQQLATITPDNFMSAVNEALNGKDYVTAVKVIAIAKQAAEENKQPPEEIERIKESREAKGEEGVMRTLRAEAPDLADQVIGADPRKHGPWSGSEIYPFLQYHLHSRVKVPDLPAHPS